MTAHLLNLSIGPVQEFIAAARRTRDLWFGSFLLSEISNAAASAVKSAGCTLIFPADVAADNEDSNVANVILAVVTTDPGEVSRKARVAAEACWLRYADATKKEFGAVIRDELWQEQRDGVLEVFAAWVPLSDGGYREARARLGQLLAGRKNVRNFAPGPVRSGLPKSSLDGLRETVLIDTPRKHWPDRLRARMRIRDGEQLDVVGVVKRTGGGIRRYPSVSRVAADTWLRGVATKGIDLSELKRACAALDGLHRIQYPPYEHFPHEGTAVYRNRHHELLEETGDPEERLADLRAALAKVEHAAAKAGLGREPDPYLAVLVADGDKMGEAIRKLETVEANQDFSRRLAGFATEARTIVAKHHGVLVYAGGDDVLAFLPLDTALKCARELHDDFGVRMGPATLSVGIAIAHFYEHMEDLLDHGRAAEKAAKKPDRDGLAVHLHKRGGVPIEVRSPWKTGPEERLLKYARWFRDGSISGRTPYELHRLADVYDGWPTGTMLEAIQRDAVRVIDRKRPGGDKGDMDEIREEISGRPIESPDDLRALAKELLVARQLAVARKQSGEATP